MKSMASSLGSEHRPAWLDKNLFPFQSRYLDVNGCQVHYVDEGAGPILLLLHGNPTWSFLYRDIIKALSKRMRCIALDYPGFGLSSASAGYRFTPAEHAEILEKFLLALKLSEVTLMVHDWGGPIGLGVAGRLPHRFRALVIGNTWAWPLNDTPRFERFSKLVGGPVGHFFIRHFNAFVNLLMPLGVRKREKLQRVMTAYRLPFPSRASREPTYIFPRELLDSHDYLVGVQQRLVHLRSLPVLIVWGDHDLAFQAAERQRFEQLFPRHHTVILQGAGHYIQEDAADEIVEAIASWWPDRVSAK